jgi:hypothetical protein
VASFYIAPGKISRVLNPKSQTVQILRNRII